MSLSNQPYVRAAIAGEIARLSSATEGDRNSTLFKATASLASLGLNEGEILRHFAPIAQGLGLGDKELHATVKSGMRAGRANPRIVPSNGHDRHLLGHSLATETTGSVAVEQATIHFVGCPEGPLARHDEVRRHGYAKDGKCVRIKIKRSDGSFQNWYRVSGPTGDGWQPKKPHDYRACPYVGPVNPFDPELVDDEVYWPEGEKDCDTLGSHHLPAFTFGGTGDGLPPGAVDFIRGRHLVILADNDAAGREHAAKKATVAYSVAASVKVVDFPELPPKADVSDFLGAASVHELEKRVADAPLWSPAADVSKAAGWRRLTITADALLAKTFAPVKYILPGYIPEGITIFAGKPKIGKSWFLYDVCLATAADRFVLGTLKPVQGDVLYLSLEDSQRRLKRRLAKLCPEGTRPNRLTLATEWRRSDEGGITDIREWCQSVTEPTLVAIDTLEKFRPVVKSGSQAYSTDYLAITGLHKLAHELGISIIVSHHVRKMEAEDPFDMVSGTNGLTGAADTILVLKREKRGRQRASSTG